MGHIVASSLPLRLDQQAAEVSWFGLMRDLSQVQSVIVELDGHNYQLRTNVKGAARKAFTAAGVRPPPTLSPLEPQPEPKSPNSSTSWQSFVRKT
jgi:hypothetical protein